MHVTIIHFPDKLQDIKIPYLSLTIANDLGSSYAGKLFILLDKDNLRFKCITKNIILLFCTCVFHFAATNIVVVDYVWWLDV